MSDSQPPLHNFVAAILLGDDEATEAICQQLREDDAPILVAISEASELDHLSTTLQAVASGSTDREQLEQLLPDFRWWAIRALAICGQESALASLVNLLRSSEAEIRSVAVLSLGHIGKRLTAQDAENLQVMRAAASIAELLDDPNGTVRQSSADALVLLGGFAVPVLQSVLIDGSESARGRAAYSLRKIGTQGGAVKETAPVLFQILNDDNYLVHTYAHEALDEMGLLDNVLVVL